MAGMPFEWSINPYRGCQHGCVFCYARSTHDFLQEDGVRAWDSRLYVKVNAVAVVRFDLAGRCRTAGEVAIGTATDPYQPVEGVYRLTRGILQTLARARMPAHLITRSPLAVRDVDVMQELSRRASFSICFSVPTLDDALARRLEPGVAPPRSRLRAVQRLAAAGIRTGVAIAPVVPEITDGESALRDVLEAARDSGAAFAWSSVLNLGAVARESHFSYLQRERSDLIERYRRWYNTRYAPRSLVNEIQERVRRARTGITFEARNVIEPEPATELSLFAPR